MADVSTSNGDDVAYFRQHESLVDTCQPKWVFASGVRGAHKLRIRLANREEADASEAAYLVRLYLRTEAHAAAGSGDVQLKLQGQIADQWTSLQRDRIFLAGAIREYSPIAVGEFLDVEFVTDPQAPLTELPELCGLEVVLLDP